MNMLVNLHSIPALRKISVNEEIVLRPLQKSDAIRILEILHDDSVICRRVTVASRFHKVKDVENEILHYLQDGGLMRYIILKAGNPIGLISLWRDFGYFGTGLKPNDYGFGYFLDPKERGKGIVTNSIKSIMRTLSKNLTVDNFVAFCEDDNHESIAVLKKLGFKQSSETYIEPRRGWIERKYIRTVKSKRFSTKISNKTL